MREVNRTIGPVNNLLHSMLSRVDVFLNGKRVTSPTATYPYRAYIETLLNYGPATKMSQLTAALCYKDTAGKFNLETNADLAKAKENKGFEKRYAITLNSTVFEMAGPLFCDIFRSDRFLLNHMDLRVVLHGSDDRLCLMRGSNSDGSPKLQIEEVKLKLCKVQVHSTINTTHEFVLKENPGAFAAYKLRILKGSKLYQDVLRNRKAVL